MCTQYIEYKPRRVLNVYKHCDGAWFWNRYSANPYVGCEYGCEYCYFRAKRYFRFDWDFSEVIKVKVNAPILLRKELSKVKKDITMLGFYQPVEVKYRLIRSMLEVCAELGFPVHMNEKSDLILRDLDVLKEINERSWACVTFSIITKRKSLRIWEPKAPSVEKRFEAMKEISGAGITTGTALIPVLPFIYDDDENIEEIVRETAESGGKYVIGGSLTLGSPLTEHYLSILRENWPDLVEPTVNLFSSWKKGREKADYPKVGDVPDPTYQAKLGRKVKEICERYGLSDRIERPLHIYPPEIRSNKAVANYLFERTYRLELEGAPPHKIWAYRKAAWTIDEMEISLKNLLDERGFNGLLSLPNVGKKIAKEILQVLKEVD